MVKVSVVIPVYNVEDFLGECLDSIINQTLKDIEIICVNDGSQDRSLEILNEYASRDERMTVLDQENGGHAVATNRGMRLATGKYIFFMDSDDILELTALEETYNVAEERNVDFVIFQAINYYMDTGELVEAENYSMNELADFVGDSVFNYRDIRDYVFKITVTPWSKLYNREFVMKNNIIYPEGFVFDDNVFFYDTLFAADRITFLRKHLFKRRWYSTSSTTSGGQHFANYIDICDLIWQVFFKYGEFDNYKENLLHKKFYTNFHWYRHIKPEFKQYFLDRLREDYRRIASDEEFKQYIIKDLTDAERRVFESVLTYEDVDTFDYAYENYMVRLKNESLKRRYENARKTHDDLINSNSWQKTRMLRSIKK
ncbi:glycosyltransferase family 2 protein [Methanobrevibacter sp.]|uniref:glycosyltransferase family 2 protein n=1 Tax=Methanobrevibacter sp. TaxID=66852 RepID=UPI00388E0924